jgi:hypothetical protein
MLINKVGTFLILIGLLLIGLFIYSDLVDAPACGYLFFGGITLAAGIYMWFRNPLPPPKPPDRFRLFRKQVKK